MDVLSAGTRPITNILVQTGRVVVANSLILTPGASTKAEVVATSPATSTLQFDLLAAKTVTTPLSRCRLNSGYRNRGDGASNCEETNKDFHDVSG